MPELPKHAAVDSNVSPEALAGLQAFAENSADAMFFRDLSGRIRYCNAATARMLGREVSQIVGQEVGFLLGTNPPAILPSPDQEVLTTGKTVEFVHSLISQGERRVYQIQRSPFRNSQGEIAGILDFWRDVTAPHDIEVNLLACKQILEKIAREQPLVEILNGINEHVERMIPGARCSILFCDHENQILRSGAVASLPADYSAAIEGISMTEGVGSCGTAAARRQEVLVIDVETDPLWADYRHLAEKFDFRSCWSIPIFSSRFDEQGRCVLGTFAIYRREPSQPNPDDLELVRTAAHLAGIAIERELSTRVLKENETFFHTLIDEAADAFFLHELDGRLIDVNRRACESLGYTREELLTKTVFDIEKNAALPLSEEWWSSLQQGHAHTLEGIHRRKDGSEFPVEVRLGRVEIKGRKMIFALVRDISRRYAVERQLRLTQFSIDRAADSIFWINPAAEIIYVNNAACQKLGYSREELIGKSVADIDPNFPSDGWPAHWEEVKQRGSFTFESTQRTKQGQILPTEVTVNYLQYEGQEYNCAFVRDISERNQAEEALRTSRRTIQAVSDALPLTVYVYDLHDRKLVYSNLRIQTVLGYTNYDLPNLDWHMLQQIVHPEDFELMPNYLKRWKTMQDGEHLESEYRLKHADGTWHWFLSRDLAFSRTDGGEVRQIIGTAQDITERKQLEQQFRESQKMEAVGQLAGGIAHDFNNLLTIINGYCDLLLSQQNVDNSCRSSILEIRDAGHRAADLTRQLLAFSRRAIINPKVINLNAAVVRSTSLLQRLIEENILLKIDLDQNLGFIRVDTGQLDQVLMNLAVNARDAMPLGGQLTISTRQTTAGSIKSLYGQDLPDGHYAELTVIDTGSGIPADVLSLIFDPFFTTKETGKGTGLGLAVVYGIVKQFGGSIQVASKLNHGTTFRLWFPIVTAEQPAAEPQMPTASPLTSGTILLVEDELSLKNMIRTVLATQGFRVLEATDPQHALEIFQAEAHAIDLLITDVIMPEMTGYELADRLRLTNPDLRILFTSGYTNREDQNRPGGRNETFLQKPFSPEVLLEKISEQIRTATDQDS